MCFINNNNNNNIDNTTNTNTNYLLHTYILPAGLPTRHTYILPDILPYILPYMHANVQPYIQQRTQRYLFQRRDLSTCASSPTTTCSRSPPCLWRFTKGNDLPQDLSSHDDTGAVHIWTRVDSTLGAWSSSKHTQARRADCGWVDGRLIPTATHHTQHN